MVKINDHSEIKGAIFCCITLQKDENFAFLVVENFLFCNKLYKCCLKKVFIFDFYFQKKKNRLQCFPLNE